MNTDEIEQLIRMAQVLKVRSRMLSHELAKAKHGPQSSRATQVHYLAQDAEDKLTAILEDVLGAA